MNMLQHLLYDKPAATPKFENPMVPKRSDAYGTVAPRVLAYLKSHPNCTPNELRESLELNRYSVDRGLRKLKAEGLAGVVEPAVITGKNRSPAKWRAK